MRKSVLAMQQLVAAMEQYPRKQFKEYADVLVSCVSFDALHALATWMSVTPVTQIVRDPQRPTLVRDELDFTVDGVHFRVTTEPRPAVAAEVAA